MPRMTLITAMRVVVARMMPRRVRKLLSLLERRDAAAPVTASQKDAVWLCILGGRRGRAPVCSLNPRNPVQNGRLGPESPAAARQEGDMTAVPGCQQGEERVGLEGRVVIRLE